MESSCMTSLRQTLRQIDDLPDKWLKIAAVCLGFTSLIGGFFTMAFGIMQNDKVFLACGILGLILFLLMFGLQPCFGVVYTLWFVLAALLLVMGGTLTNVQKEVSYFCYALGSVFMVLLLVAFLLACNFSVPRDAASRVLNLAVAYHVPTAQGEAEVAPEKEDAPEKDAAGKKDAAEIDVK